MAKDVIPTLCNDADKFPAGDRLMAEGKTGVKAGEGMLRKYPDDIDEYVKKRNRRIVEMYKMMNKFEEEDEK